MDSAPVLPAFFGFIVVAPDYIGYGESKGVMHPYLNAKVTASSSIDLLRAGQTFLKNKNIMSNEQLFLGGYSEGGSAALASQKMLEEDLANEFNVTATSAGAGAYNLSLDLEVTSESILQNFETANIVRPSNLGLIAKAMDHAYGLNIISEMFQPEYATVVDTIYDATKSGDYIDQQLSFEAGELLKKDFIQRLVNGEEKEVSAAFKNNDLVDWAPQAPTRLFHGREDDWVNFKHTQTTYDAMLAKKAPSVELIECEVAASLVANHGNCYSPYLYFTYDFFLQYASDL